MLYKFILERSDEKNPISENWEFDNGREIDWNPFLAAARYGNLETYLFMMEKFNVVNPPNNKKFTPLHAAASGGHLEIVRMIINNLDNQNSESKNPKDENELTPLHCAAEKGHIHVCRGKYLS